MEITQTQKDAIIGAVLKYLELHPSGEHIMQSDEAQIEALELVCDLADILSD